MKHIICYSGGHSSALVAIEVVRKFGNDNVILLNHCINPKRENPDIQRFKEDVAAYLGIDITYANIDDIDTPQDIPDQFDVCQKANRITSDNGHAICTSKLKTQPFEKFLREKNFNTLFGDKCIIYYGFDASEKTRIQRRIGILGAMGFKTDYPLATWKERTIFNTREIGIEPPLTYGVWKHANCTGCLKGGILHWYCTYAHDREAFEKAKQLEINLDYAINEITTNKIESKLFLYELECYFAQMLQDGIEATEHQSAKKFVIMLRKKYGLHDASVAKPCVCVV